MRRIENYLSIYFVPTTVGLMVSIDSLVDYISVAAQTDWWSVFLVSWPCYNQHAPSVDHTTVTRRLCLLTMAIVVVFASTFYQIYLLNGLLMSREEPTLTVEQLTIKLESAQMRAMFWEPQSIVEMEMRKRSSFDRFIHALDVHPPLYRTRLNTTVFEVLRDQPVVYIEQLDTDVMNIIINYIPYMPILCPNSLGLLAITRAGSLVIVV